MTDSPQAGPAENNSDGQIRNPGILGLELSIVNIHLDELHNDDSLPPEKRQLYLQYYFHQREKFHSRLKTLALQEKVQLCERELAENESAITFARSEAGAAKARERWQQQLRAAALSGGSKNAYEISQIPKSAEEAERAFVGRFESERQNALTALATARSELDTSILLFKSSLKHEAIWNVHLPEINEWERTQEWEQITPKELRPAVKALRKKFDHHAWKVRRSTEVFCYEALHPRGPSLLEAEDAGQYQNFLIAFLGNTGRRLFTGEKFEPPAIFKRYFDAYLAGVKIVTSAIFNELLEIAIQQAQHLACHPIEWTKKHLLMLIRSEKTDVRLWIRAVCDHDSPYRPGDIDESIYWGQWRAPRLVHMEPAGNTLSDPDNAWTRDNVEESQMILEAQGKHFTVLLEVALDKIVDEGHIQFAKQNNRLENRWIQHPEAMATAREYQDQQAKSERSATGSPESDMWPPNSKETRRDFTKFPSELKEASIDPIEINPFPKDHVANDAWAKATRKASEKILRFRAEMLDAAPSPYDMAAHDRWFIRLVVGQFDIWAERYVHVIWTEEMFANFSVWLVTYAEAWLESCKAMEYPPQSIDTCLADLRHHLMSRTEWWKAEARRYLNLQLEAKAQRPTSSPSQVKSKPYEQAKSEGTGRPVGTGLQYPRSETKRVIALQLAKRPGATDAEICFALDEDGAELPKRWQSLVKTRLFAEAYSSPRLRNKVETMISKVRRDMRNGGLLHGK